VALRSRKGLLDSGHPAWFADPVPLMSSGTFGYPLCFSAMIAVIGLMVLPRSEHRKPLPTKPYSSTPSKHETTETKAPLNPKIAAELMERCDEFIRKYPDSEYSDVVATLAGEMLVQMGDWKKVAVYYHGLEDKFPKSESIDRFVFFQGLAFFMDANFKESTPRFTRFLKNYPNSALIENASYYLAMSYFLSNKHKETLAACGEYLKKFPDGQFAGDMRHRLSFNDKDKPRLKNVEPNKEDAKEAE
jgi:tetratricopeptide (TPR) repeat protein